MAAPAGMPFLRRGAKSKGFANELEAWLKWSPLSCFSPFCSAPRGDALDAESQSELGVYRAERPVDEVDGCSPATYATASTRFSFCDADDLPEDEDEDGDESYDDFLHDGAAEDEGVTPGGRRALRLDMDCRQVPHPDKAHYGGEDGVFVCPHSSAAGVADGVGEWGSKFGVNPCFFARELMEGCRMAAEGSHVKRWWALGNQSASEHAEEVMAAGYQYATSFGAATVCVMVFDPSCSQVGVASLGDSGMRLLRRSPWTGRMYIAGRTQEQQHGFNRPFQLSRLPRPQDFPRLVALGLTRLVRSAERRMLLHQDGPEDAGKYIFPVEEGDVIVMGSDGLFDNLSDYEICRHVDGVMPSLPWRWEGRRPRVARGLGERVAQLLSQAAAARSKESEGTTPWTLYTRQHGIHYPGGKLDDVTVVAACVTR